MVTVVGPGGFKGTGAFTGGGAEKLPSGRTKQYRGKGDYSGIRGFRVEFERPSPGPYEQLARDAVAVRGASIEAVVQTTTEVKERIRDYIDAHFTNSEFHRNGRRRVSNASAQSAFYDEVEERGQYAGLVYSKFGKRDGGGFVDFLLLHIRGGTVKPKSGDWLRIAATGQRGGPNAQSGFFAYSQSDIFFRKSKDGKKLYQFRRYRKSGVSARRNTLELIATLVKSVTFPASLSGVDEIARSRPELFERHFTEALRYHWGEEG